MRLHGASGRSRRVIINSEAITRHLYPDETFVFMHLREIVISFTSITVLIPPSRISHNFDVLGAPGMLTAIPMTATQSWAGSGIVDFDSPNATWCVTKALSRSAFSMLRIKPEPGPTFTRCAVWFSGIDCATALMTLSQFTR